MFIIYEITPDKYGDHHRFVQGFEQRKDAEHVLNALENVNIDFNLYIIKQVGE